MSTLVTTTRTRLLALLLVGPLCGCAASRPATNPLKPFVASEHVGVWQSEGYGHVIVATSDGVQLYHATDDVCVQHPEGELSTLDFLDLYRTSERGRVLHLSSLLEPFEYEYRRIGSLPAPCLAPAQDSPTSNFDALASFFGQHYAFFDLYSVDWDERVAIARVSIDDNMSDRALFESMSALLRPLKDSHIQIDGEIDGEDAVYDGDFGRTDVAVTKWGERNGMAADEAANLFRRNYWLDDIRDALLMGDGEIAGNGRIQHGVLEGNVGYIAFASMGGFVDGEFDTAYEEGAALARIMDNALATFEARGVAAVVIDLSLNIGGYDFIGLDIAGRFADEQAAAFTRRPGDAKGALAQTLYVEPSSGRQYTGPVYVLTSDLTVSAAEIMTLGLRALDNVTHVGERTRGAFSTVLTKYLPNGWEISLSNEVYTDPQGETWEGRGIDPAVHMPVFDAENPFNGHVEAVRGVVDMIRERD